MCARANSAVLARALDSLLLANSLTLTPRVWDDDEIEKDHHEFLIQNDDF